MLDEVSEVDDLGRLAGEAAVLDEGIGTVGTAIEAGADVSVTVRMDPAVKSAIATIPRMRGR